MAEMPMTDPSGLIALRDGLYADDLVLAGVTGLDLLTWLGRHPSTEEEIARGLQLAPRPLNVLLTLFLTMGLLEWDGTTFRPTLLAREHLTQGSPWDLRPFYSSQQERPQCREFLEILRTGKQGSWSSKSQGGAWESLMEEDDFAAEFTAAMDSRGANLAPAMAEALPVEDYTELLDIAGGSGIYACSVVDRHPHMRAAVLEKPPVDRAAQCSIERRGMAGQVRVLAGDMFAEDLPSGFDVHLWSHVLHDWDLPEVSALLAKSFAVLPRCGMVAIHDAHLDPDRRGPLAVARFSALLMHATEGRCYSVDEMRHVLGAQGFGEIEHIPTASYRSLVVARKP